MKTTLGAIVSALFLFAPAMASAEAGYGCDSVNFSQEVLDKFPNAKKACRGVMEKNGSVYVKYTGKVVSSSPESTTVEFLDKDNKPVSRATFKPAADQMASVSGKKTKYSALEKNTELNFYIEHNRWGLYSSPDSTAMTILSVEQL
jgi:hypothetical protein